MSSTICFFQFSMNQNNKSSRDRRHTYTTDHTTTSTHHRNATDTRLSSSFRAICFNDTDSKAEPQLDATLHPLQGHQSHKNTHQSRITHSQSMPIIQQMFSLSLSLSLWEEDGKS